MDKIGKTKTKGAWNYGLLTPQVTKQVQKNYFIGDVLPDQIFELFQKLHLTHASQFMTS